MSHLARGPVIMGIDGKAIAARCGRDNLRHLMRAMEASQ
jgi:hypothetical protein